MAKPLYITLFTASAGTPDRRLSLFVSLLAHAGSFAVLSFALLENPRIVQARGSAYRVQKVSVRIPPPERTTSTVGQEDGLASPVFTKAALRRASHALPAPFFAYERATVTQVLLQADSPIAQINEALVPSLLILAPQAILDVRHMVPPASKSFVPTVAHPSAEPLTAVLNSDEAQISPTDHSSEKLPLPTAALLPINLPGSFSTGPAPQTYSDPGPVPTPARVLSVSPLRLTSGEFVLPHASNLSRAVPPAPGAGGLANTTSAGGHPEEKGATHSQIEPTATRHIVQPIDGHYATILVGDSAVEAYPETASLWGGRLAYTVSLHVGLPSTWRLQYALSQTESVPVSGMQTRLEPPWPVDMTVPHLEDFSNQAEALLFRGVIDAAGQFASLQLLFPSQFSRSVFALDALRQWRFRPAQQNGRAVAVEIVLIVPGAP